MITSEMAGYCITPGCWNVAPRGRYRCQECDPVIGQGAQPEPRTPDETLADAWTRAWDHAGDHREYIHGVAAVGDAIAESFAFDLAAAEEAVELEA